MNTSNPSASSLGKKCSDSCESSITESCFVFSTTEWVYAQIIVTQAASMEGW